MLCKYIPLKNEPQVTTMNTRMLVITLTLFIAITMGNDRRALAQDFDESNFIRYTRLEGLSNNYISGVVQDSTGYVWVATHKGLNRFDGKTFKATFKSSLHSPLPDNLLTSMHTRTSGEIIGTTLAGAFAYNPASGQHKRFIVPSDTAIFFWANQSYDIITDKNGNYIVSTKTGLYIFNASGKLIQRYDHHPPSDAGRRELLFGTSLSALGDGYILQQNAILGSLYSARTNRIDTLFIANKPFLKKQVIDETGDFRMTWGGKKGELFIANNEKNSIDIAAMDRPVTRSIAMPFSVKNDLGFNSQLIYLNDSLLVLTCSNTGFYLLCYDAATKQLFCDGKKNFGGSICTTAFKDKEGRLWIGTSDGLYKQNLHNSFFSVTDLAQQSTELKNHDIRSIYVEGGLIYLGLQNDGGLLVMDKYSGHIKKQLFLTPTPAYSNNITNIMPYDGDTLWIGTSKGILWLDKKNYRYGRLETPPELAWMQTTSSLCLFEDSRKNIWASFLDLNRLVRYNRGDRSFTEISTPLNPLLKITFVFSMAEDVQGNLWLAGDGLCRYNIKKEAVDTLIPYPRVSKVIRNYMLILDRDKGNNLWLSSFDNEIIQYNCTTNTMFLRQQENNLVDGNTVTSSPIINHTIWMGTDNGISAFNVRDYSIKQFTYADGLPSVAITSVRKRSFYDTASNRFYIGTRHRLISLVPDVTLLNKAPPALFIEGIIARDSLMLPVRNEIRLDHNQNNVTITFNTINYTDPEENRFAWRTVTAGDTSWNELNNQTSITLTNLAGGWRVVQVKLYSVNNHWPYQVKTIRIYIHPPFWKTSWFLFYWVLLLPVPSLLSIKQG